MSRSLKKGPYINVKLEKRILAMNESGKKVVVKTWARASMISPDFVGHTVAVHNGNKFIPVYVTENMVGHKLGEFAPTRTFMPSRSNGLRLRPFIPNRHCCLKWRYIIGWLTAPFVAEFTLLQLY